MIATLAAMNADRDPRSAALASVEQSMMDLFRIAKVRTRQLAERLHPDLSPLGFGVLRYVMGHGPLRSGDIVTAFGIDKAAVSRQVATLRELGLLDAAPDPADGRATLLTATPATAAQFAAVRDAMTAEYEQALETWDDAELTDFARLLARLAVAIA